jgi:hypothetical protein
MTFATFRTPTLAVPALLASAALAAPTLGAAPLTFHNATEQTLTLHGLNLCSPAMLLLWSQGTPIKKGWMVQNRKLFKLAVPSGSWAFMVPWPPDHELGVPGRPDPLLVSSLEVRNPAGQALAKLAFNTILGDRVKADLLPDGKGLMVELLPRNGVRIQPCLPAATPPGGMPLAEPHAPAPDRAQDEPDADPAVG